MPPVDAARIARRACNLAVTVTRRVMEAVRRLARPAAPVRSLRRADWQHLTPFQRINVSSCLAGLGCDEGVIEDTAPVTDPGERQWISRLVATDLHLELHGGEEIAQCQMDLAVIAGDDAVRDARDNYLFCSDDCLHAWESEQDAPSARFAA